MSERNEVSIHECRLFSVISQSKDKWLSSREIAEKAEVSYSTARHQTLKLVRLGILDQAELFPCHRFRLADKADKRNQGYLRRLSQACEIFGITV